MYSLKKYNQIESVLGECFDIQLLEKLHKEWRAFYENPEKYRDTVVVEMVNLWIDSQPIRL